jgi:hypothetical protein
VGDVSNYWMMMRLDAAGRCQIKANQGAQTFFRQQFPKLLNLSNPIEQINHRAIQQQLWQEAVPNSLAESCLRCYISHQVNKSCTQIAARFGQMHGFTAHQLYPFVLDDDGRSHNASSSYQTVAMMVLRTFDPAKGPLETWVSRCVKQHQELREFLLQHGVYLLTDWAILNDTPSKRLQKILTTDRTPLEIQIASNILSSFHAIYRSDRLQRSERGTCQPPTIQQLIRMTHYLQQTSLQQTSRTRSPEFLSPESLLEQLQAIAHTLRQHRIATQRGMVSMQSLDDSDIHLQPNSQDSAEDEHLEFLTFYREQLLRCLDQAVINVTRDRLVVMRQKRPPKDQIFLNALCLFHCQGESMSRIAPQVGLNQQYEVTRLLNLKEFRADVRQHLLNMLKVRVIDKAQYYADSRQLILLDCTLETILDEQITTLIHEAEAEAQTTSRSARPQSLFANRLCQALDQMGGLGHD